MINKSHTSGIFSASSAKVTSLKPSNFTFESEYEAMLTIVYAAAIADGFMDPTEVEHISGLLLRGPVKLTTDPTELYSKVLSNIKQAAGSIKGLVAAAGSRLSESNKRKAFLFSADIIMADGFLDDKEEEMMQELKSVLDIDDVFAQATRMVMNAKNHA